MSGRATSTACCASGVGRDGVNHRRSLVHGTILHGTQYLSPDLRGDPTTYYTHTSGIGRLLECCIRDEPLKVGVIGLGTGTLAALRREGRRVSLLRHQPEGASTIASAISPISGTATRRSSSRWATRACRSSASRAAFDVLAIDAFSSDAIPVHLITSEALGIYRRHMKPAASSPFT